MNTKKIKLDPFLIFSLMFFAAISLISISSASMYLSKTLGNLVLKQALWYGLGIVIIFCILKLKLNFFLKLAPYLYIMTNLLLLGLLFFAPVINGSKCWYVLEGIGSFQPSEFMKISLVLMEVYVIDRFKAKNSMKSTFQEFKLLVLIGLIFLVPAILTFLEPDTGAIISYLIITLFILFISEIRLRWFIILGGLAIIGIAIFFGLYFFQKEMFIQLLGSDFFYRIDRLLNWQNGSGMQLENSLAAIATSGFLGHGYNQTPLYFPEAGTDFIFTVFASNFGFLGCSILIFFILCFDLHLLKLAYHSKEKKHQKLLAGVLAILFYQQVQNMAMTIGLLPITGITLPFISYGGSSLLAYMILLGFCFYIYHEQN